MSELVGRVLHNLYEKKGETLLEDPQQLQHLLEDLCPDEKRAIRLVMLGLARQVPRRLLQAYAAEGASLLQVMVRELEQSFGMDRRFGNWVVETWGMAQGLLPTELEPRNIFAEAEAEYRQALLAACATGELTPHLQSQLEQLRERLLLERQTAELILAEVQEEIRRQQKADTTVQAPDIWVPPLKNSLEMEFIRVEPGQFQMGSPEYERQRESDEQLHTVTLSRPYYLQTTPVTQAQWQAVMGQNPSDFKGPALPVENVSWNDVITQFLPRLNAMGEGSYRLPTEAEWEYAARTGCIQAYYNQDDAALLDRFAWYNNNANFQTHPVAAKDANAWGFYDLHGNVWEWCQDWHMPYTSESCQDPQGPLRGPGRVMRGGCWFSNASDCRLAARGYMPPETRIRLIGFRLVREDEAALSGS